LFIKIVSNVYFEAATKEFEWFMLKAILIIETAIVR
jgi:hypothetical protein